MQSRILVLFFTCRLYEEINDSHRSLSSLCRRAESESHLFPVLEIKYSKRSEDRRFVPDPAIGYKSDSDVCGL